MKANFPYDDGLRERFDHFEPEVPSHIWENIARKSPKKRPFFIWPWSTNVWLLLIFSFGFLGVGGYFFYSNTSAKKSITTSEKHQSSSSTHHSSDQAISNFNVANPAVEDVQKNNHAVDIQHHQASTLSGTSKDSHLNIDQNSKHLLANHSENNNALQQNDTSNAATSAANANRMNRKYVHNHQVNQIDSLSTVNNNESTDHQGSENAGMTLDQHHRQTRNVGHQKRVRTQKPNWATISDDTNDDEVAINHSSPSNEWSTVNATAMGEIELMKFNHYNFSGHIFSEKKPSVDIPCPNADLNPAWNKEYLDIYSSADYVIRQFNDTPNSSYMQMRKQSTSFSSAFSVGVRYNKVFENGLSFRVGLNYSQINEKFQFVQGNIIQLQYILNANGDTIGSYESVYKRYKTSYNKYRTIDVPITMGYEKAFGKCTINLSAGIVLNAYSWNRGEVLDKNLQPVNINNTDTTNPYQLKNNIGLGGIASASFYYPINEQWKLFAEPYFRYNFSSMSSKELTLKQKYHTAGLRIGLRFDLK